MEVTEWKWSKGEKGEKTLRPSASHNNNKNVDEDYTN